LSHHTNPYIDERSGGSCPGIGGAGIGGGGIGGAGGWERRLAGAITGTSGLLTAEFISCKAWASRSKIQQVTL